MQQTSQQDRMSKALRQAGLPQFQLDRDGFPLPGPVIKYYREQMKYLDKDGKMKHWSQVDLAKRLQTSDLTVRLMETKNKGLDSLERRRTLVTLLKIPPVLLGLASIDQLVEALAGDNYAHHPSASTKTSVGSEEISLYQNAFKVYDDTHSTSTAQGALEDIEQWIARIQDRSSHASAKDKSTLLQLLWNFHALSAKIYSDDLFDWPKSFDHLNTALALATEIQNPDLQTASLYRSAQIRFAQRNYALAKTDLEGALVYAQKASPSIKGATLASASLAFALVDQEHTGIYPYKLLEQAEKYTKTPDNTHIITFNSGKYLLDKADTLLALHKPEKALDTLDDAEDLTDKNQKRRLAYLNILRAESYTSLRKPDYEGASMLLLDALEASKAVKSAFNLGHIQRLYQVLAASPYAKSPDVVDLGMQLRELKRGAF